MSAQPSRDDHHDAWQMIALLGSRLVRASDVAECLRLFEACVGMLWPGAHVEFTPGWRLPRSGVSPEWSRQRVLAEGLPVLVSRKDPVPVDGLVSVCDDIIVPLARGTRAIGILAVHLDRSVSGALVDREMLLALQGQMALAIDNLNARMEIQYKEAYGRALGDFDFLIASHDVKEILKHSVRQIHESVAAEQTWVVMYDEDSQAPMLEAIVGEAPGPDWLATEQGRAVSHCLASKRSLVLGPVVASDDEAWATRMWQGALTPIMANRKLYGVLAVFRPLAHRTFHRNDVTFVNQVALKLALVLQNTEAYQTINGLNEVLEQRVLARTAELERALLSLQETQAQLMQTEKLATIGTLAGGVAHELNNPLSAILANVQLLRLDITDPELCDQLALVEAGAQRCKHIVVNLLNFARQPSPEYRPVSVNVVLRDTLDLLNHRLKHMSVVRELTLTDLPPVMGTVTELGQVLTNLIVNAMDAIQARYGEEPGGVLRIVTAFESDMVQVDIIDNGDGVPDAIKRKIFDPFFTTKQVGKGTGLGLSVSQQIVRNFGGSLVVLSEAGKGATFRLCFPPAALNAAGGPPGKRGTGDQNGQGT